MASNQYEAKARAQKAHRLYDVARRNRLTALQVATGVEVRAALVTLAGVNEPSDETWRMVVQAMERAERQGVSILSAVA